MLVEKGCASHKNQILRFDSLYLDFVDSINFGNKWFWILANMMEVFSEKIEPRCEISCSHGFNQELSVAWKEEETSTLTHTFSRCFDCLDIFFKNWVQCVIELFVIKSVFVSQVSKNIWGVLSTSSSLSDLSVLGSFVSLFNFDKPKLLDIFLFNIWIFLRSLRLGHNETFRINYDHWLDHKSVTIGEVKITEILVGEIFSNLTHSIFGNSDQDWVEKFRSKLTLHLLIVAA